MNLKMKNKLLAFTWNFLFHIWAGIFVGGKFFKTFFKNKITHKHEYDMYNKANRGKIHKFLNCQKLF